MPTAATAAAGAVTGKTEQLRQALVSELTHAGVLQKLKAGAVYAQLRADAYTAAQSLKTQGDKNAQATTFKHDLTVPLRHGTSNERLAVELVMEFLAFYDMTYTLAVLGHEGNIKDRAHMETIDRRRIAQDAGVTFALDSPRMPLLASVLSTHGRSVTAATAVRKVPSTESLSLATPPRPAVTAVPQLGTPTLMLPIPTATARANEAAASAASPTSSEPGDEAGLRQWKKKMVLQESLYGSGGALSNKSSNKLAPVPEAVKKAAATSSIPKPASASNSTSNLLEASTAVTGNPLLHKSSSQERLSRSSSLGSVHSVLSPVSESISKSSSHGTRSGASSASVSRSSSISASLSNSSGKASVLSSPSSQKSANIERRLLDDAGFRSLHDVSAQDTSLVGAEHEHRTVISNPQPVPAVNQVPPVTLAGYVPETKSPELHQFDLGPLHPQRDTTSPLSLLVHLTPAKPTGVEMGLAAVTSSIQQQPKLPLPPLVSPFDVGLSPASVESAVLSRTTEQSVSRQPSQHSSAASSPAPYASSSFTAAAAAATSPSVVSQATPAADANTSLYDDYKEFQRSLSKDAINAAATAAAVTQDLFTLPVATTNAIPPSSSSSSLARLLSSTQPLHQPLSSTPAKRASIEDLLKDDSALFKADSDADLATADYTISPPSELDQSYLHRLQQLEGVDPVQYLAGVGVADEGDVLYETVVAKLRQ